MPERSSLRPCGGEEVLGARTLELADLVRANFERVEGRAGEAEKELAPLAPEGSLLGVQRPHT